MEPAGGGEDDDAALLITRRADKQVNPRVKNLFEDPDHHRSDDRPGLFLYNAMWKNRLLMFNASLEWLARATSETKQGIVKLGY